MFSQFLHDSLSKVYVPIPSDRVYVYTVLLCDASRKKLLTGWFYGAHAHKLVRVGVCGSLINHRSNNIIFLVDA